MGKLAILVVLYVYGGDTFETRTLVVDRPTCDAMAGAIDRQGRARAHCIGGAP